MAKIVLASGSPRRQELLRRMGITDFTVRVPEVEEYFPAGLTPEETVCYISREKSQAVASDADEIVITADTMVFLDNKKLGKPADEAEARRAARWLGEKYDPANRSDMDREIDGALSRMRMIRLDVEHMTGKEGIVLTQARNKQQ